MKLDKVSWILYPVLVLVFIVISAGYVFDASRLEKLTVDQDKIKQQQEQIANLRRKLAILLQVNMERDEQSLKLLATAVPNTKKPWFLVSEVKFAASDAAAEIADFKVDVGNNISLASPSAAASADLSPLRLRASMKMADVMAFGDFLTSLETRLPLTKVVKFDYLNGKVAIVVEGAWSLKKNTGSDSGEILEYLTKAERAKALLNGLVGLPDTEVSLNKGDQDINPF